MKSIRGYCGYCREWRQKFHCVFCKTLHQKKMHCFPTNAPYPPPMEANVLLCIECLRGLYLESA